MKKTFILPIIFISLWVQTANAQLLDGTPAPDFTLQDINGNSFNLYNDGIYQDKFIVLDFFATWCPTCWDHFLDETMENVHQWYGDEGTCDSDVIVLGIEADLTTNTEDLYGLGNYTLGDWTEGTSYRIFDLTSNEVIQAYDISYFPTYYVICPGGLVYQQNFYSSASITIAAYDCAFMNDISTVSVSDSDCGSLTYTPTLSFTNVNVETLNSFDVRYHYDDEAEQIYHWTGSLNQDWDGELTLPTQTFGLGTHVLHYALENPNGMEDENKTNNCGSPVFTISPGGEFVELNEDFSGGELPNDWVFVNFQNDLEWRYSSVNGGSLLMPGFDSFQTLDYPIYGWTPHVDLAYATSAYLQFDYAYSNFPGFSDGFTVEVRSSCLDQMVFSKFGEDLATAPPSQSSFVPQENQWETFCFDLTPFLGTDIYFWFEGFYDFGNNIYIDNFKVTATNCTVGINNSNSSALSLVYPNPATEKVYLEINENINDAMTFRILDSRGLVIQDLNPKSMNIGKNELDIQDLKSGLYLIEIGYSNHNELLKVVVE